MPHTTALEKWLAAIHVWSTLFELAMLPELFPLSAEAMTGEPMVSLLLRTLYGT